MERLDPMNGIRLMFYLNIVALVLLITFHLCSCGSDSHHHYETGIADGGYDMRAAAALKCHATNDEDKRINVTVDADSWMEVRSGGHRLHAGYASVDWEAMTATLGDGNLSTLIWYGDGTGVLIFGNGITVALRCSA